MFGNVLAVSALNTLPQLSIPLMEPLSSHGSCIIAIHVCNTAMLQVKIARGAFAVVQTNSYDGNNRVRHLRGRAYFPLHIIIPFAFVGANV